MTSLAAIILTYNEEQHIERCIKSLAGLVDEVFVVDSYSTDDTVKLATELGAKVYQNPWKNYANQFNWGLHNCPIQSDWVWRIDADEYLEACDSQKLKAQISALPQEVSGIYVKRKIIFQGRPLLHGAWFPAWHLKIWRTGKGFCENRWMDEHIKLSEGSSVELDLVQVDENLNDLTWWTGKHNGYATREMVDMLDIQYGIFTENTVVPKFFGTEEQRKRWLKLRYLKLPLFVRPVVYFFYRYIIRLGFLDGKAGFIWYVLQGFWYRFLVDAKIFELKRRFGGDEQAIIAYIRETYRLD
ncbi:glycosyltransferase family 2 protein [Mangrovibacterium sp.]|uniref:glycosyltransferase family 2 protein n=1 Tax=Mangrovibacterium sp. TaxID=1961364 RepID=UPI00356A04D3